MTGTATQTGHGSPDRAATDNFLEMPGHLLRRCHQIGVAVFLEECRALDLTPLQFGALAALDRFGPLDQSGVGRVTALDRTTVNVVLTRLEERGLVERRQSDRDRRSRIAAITAEGGQLLRAAMPHVLQAQQRMVAPLSPEEQAQLVSLLAKIAEENNLLSRAPLRLP